MGPRPASIQAMVEYLCSGSAAERTASLKVLARTLVRAGEVEEAVAATIVDAGGIPPLLEALERPDDAFSAAAVLVVLTSGGHKAAVADAGGTPALAGALASSDGGTVECAVRALHNLLVGDGVTGAKGELHEAGLIPAVVRCLSVPQAAATAASALCTLAEGSPARSAAIVAACGAHGLVPLTQEAASDEAKACAAVALAILAIQGQPARHCRRRPHQRRGPRAAVVPGHRPAPSSLASCP